jgi:hypothetical protein
MAVAGVASRAMGYLRFHAAFEGGAEAEQGDFERIHRTVGNHGVILEAGLVPVSLHHQFTVLSAEFLEAMVEGVELLLIGGGFQGIFFEVLSDLLRHVRIE